MNQDLAKQLKNAGYKQSGKGGYFSTMMAITVDSPEEIAEVSAYRPTVDELVESCQIEKCDELIIKYNPKTGWEVTHTSLGCFSGTTDTYSIQLVTSGESLDTALGRLWLKLHGHKDI